RQRWKRLFRRRELMHIDACKEFFANLTMFHYKKKEVARSTVRGLEIEFNSMRLASILGVPGNTDICEYIKEAWEESKYIKPLEITQKFANDNMITTTRRVRSAEMKPFQRFVHFVMMKNVAPRFGKRDTTSFMDLTYMDHLTTRRLVNLPRVMMRHMSYVISVKDHELPYGDWLTMVFEAFNVPLVNKQGEEPKNFDFFEETFLTMCQLKRENGVWWLSTGEHKRRDDEIDAPALNEEVNQEEQNHEHDFEWEAVVDEVELQEEEVHDAPETQGESKSAEKLYDVGDEVQEPKETTPAGVDPSIPIGSIPDSVFLKLQAELEQARARRLQDDLDKAQAENARLLALLQQTQSQP
ncbi:hypothetical protein Dimus_020324, partial [Dionaea muscipula]